MKLSVVIITKNEEDNIRECLETVKWADEVIIADDFSTDSTLKICREYTDRIFQKKLDGFGEQKQFGVDKAQGEWILVIDADERLTPELQLEIKEAISKESVYSGFKIYRKSFYLGKWVCHCDWYVAILRLFKKNTGNFDLRMVHENVLVTGNVGTLKNPMLHYSYKSIQQHVEKINSYSSFDAKELYKSGVRIRVYNIPWYLFLKPVLIFIRKYIFMKGFLDGKNGFLVSAFTSTVLFLTYIKVWELQKKCMTA